MESCRACLSTNKEMIPFDDVFVLNYNLLTNLDVTLHDELSHFSCSDCWQTVNYFMDFRTKCITSESVMTNATFKNVKDEIEQDMTVQAENCDNSDDMIYEYKVESEDLFVDESIQENENCELEEILDNFNPLLPTEEVTSIDVQHELKIKLRRSKRQKTKFKCDSKEESLKMPCGICDKIYQDQKELFQHLENHKNAKICETCQEVFCDWPELLGHRLKHIPEKQRRCHLCSKYYISHITMEYHYRKFHYHGNRSKLKCNECQRSYETPEKLKKHLWSVHSNKLLICDYCSKSFNNKQKLKIHILSHTRHKAYVCDICGHSCKYNSGLQDHKIRKHTPKKVYCKNCKRVFQSQKKHDKHICTHVAKLCPICGKEINRSARMSRHLETHGDEKRYKCDRCPAKYKTKTALQVHQNRHDGIRTKHCEFCPAKFYSATVLLKHRRIHTGERPYVCKICQKSFTGNSNLKVHMQVHGEYLINKRMKPEDVQTINKYL